MPTPVPSLDLQWVLSIFYRARGVKHGKRKLWGRNGTPVADDWGIWLCQFGNLERGK